MKSLVAYFSAQGATAKVARELAAAIDADLFEIRPETPYSAADLRWTNPLARCNREKFGKKDVPVAGRIDDFADYDTVYLGFPIWYGGAPNVVNTFCKRPPFWSEHSSPSAKATTGRGRRSRSLPPPAAAASERPARSSRPMSAAAGSRRQSWYTAPRS